MRISKTPGMQTRKRRDGTLVYYWVARSITKQTHGFQPETQRLCDGADEAAEERRAETCRRLTQELRLWLAEREPERKFDGTIGDLVRRYQHDTDSPYREVKHSTRGDYDFHLGIIERGLKACRVEDLTRSDFARWYREAREPAKPGAPERLRRAHGVMKMLRILFGYGKSMRYEGCRDAAEILSEMRFEVPKSRRVALGYEHAHAIIVEALKRGRSSIALAQALQFECTLRQIDVIGEWQPVEPGTAGIVHRGAAWSGGVLWSDISPDLVLAKRTTKTGADGEWDLKLCPLVTLVLPAVPADRRVGPVIVSEATGRPYRANNFQRDWREIARAAKVPDEMWNRDSRAGGLTEGDELGAEPRDLQKLATHASFQTTSRYIRSSTRKATDKVLELRSTGRKKGI